MNRPGLVLPVGNPAGLRILVVEDEPKMARLLRRSLERDGLRVDVTSTGENALSWADAEVYDAIVLDRMLPGIDGLEVCRRLRATGVSCLIVMISARGEMTDRRAGLDAGADDYLVKPFAMDELRARLRP